MPVFRSKCNSNSQKLTSCYMEGGWKLVTGSIHLLRKCEENSQSHRRGVRWQSCNFLKRGQSAKLLQQEGTARHCSTGCGGLTERAFLLVDSSKKQLIKSGTFKTAQNWNLWCDELCDKQQIVLWISWRQMNTHQAHCTQTQLFWSPLHPASLCHNVSDQILFL